MDYYIGRLKRFPDIIKVAENVEKVFNLIKKLERYLIPRFFSDFVYRMCHTVEDNVTGNSLCIL